MRHERLTAEISERVSLYSLGLLMPEEAAAFEAHLQQGCAICAAEARDCDFTAGQLAYLVATPPPARLREQLLARVSEEATREAETESAAPATPQVWRNWESSTTSTSVISRAESSRWEKTNIPGITVRRLFVDPTRQTVTMLVRMAAGTSYVPHRHATAEECLVLEGDINVGGEVMRAGDYQRAEAGSVHGVQSTEGGCLLFIMSSMHDELLA